MTISSHFNEEETEIEDANDLETYQQAMQAHKEQPSRYSHNEVKKLLDLA